MRNLRLDLAYDGTAYSGWQLQLGDPTLQGAIEGALAMLLSGETPRIQSAGRTDAGVHAVHQVANFRTASSIPLLGLQRGLNSILPEDIVVLGAYEAPESFDARRSARSKRYRYRILNRELADPFERNRAWHIRSPLRVEAMKKAVEPLLGEHDFSSFRAAGCSSNHPIRTVTNLTVERVGALVVLEIEAKAFLRHMVRNIVGTFVDVGLGRTEAEEVGPILDRRDRKAAGPTAPAQGLYLVSITYPEETTALDERSAM